jgi:hypothetical protein
MLNHRPSVIPLDHLTQAVQHGTGLAIIDHENAHVLALLTPTQPAGIALADP